MTDRAPRVVDIFKEVDFAKSLVWKMEKTLKTAGLTMGSAKEIHNATVAYKRKLIKAEKVFIDYLESKPKGTFKLRKVTVEERAMVGDILFYVYAIEKLFFEFDVEFGKDLENLLGV